MQYRKWRFTKMEKMLINPNKDDVYQFQWKKTVRITAVKTSELIFRKDDSD